MPVFRSTWCGRFSSPVSLSSTKELAPSAWWERRMLRRDGEVLRLGTAIGNSRWRGNKDAGQIRAGDVSAGLCLKAPGRSSTTGVVYDVSHARWGIGGPASDLRSHGNARLPDLWRPAADPDPPVPGGRARPDRRRRLQVR